MCGSRNAHCARGGEASSGRIIEFRRALGLRPRLTLIKPSSHEHVPIGEQRGCVPSTCERHAGGRGEGTGTWIVELVIGLSSFIRVVITKNAQKRFAASGHEHSPVRK